MGDAELASLWEAWGPAVSAPQPIASGDLATRPFEHLLVYVLQNKLDGSLAIWPEDASQKGQDRLLFQQGRLRKAQLRDELPAINGVLQLFARTRGVFAFYAQDVLTAGERVSIDTLALITAGLRQFPSRAMAPFLKKFGASHLRLRSKVELARLNLNAEEQAVVQLLRAAPAPVARLRQISGSPSTADRVVYILGLANYLRPYQEDEEGPKTERQRVLSSAEAEVRHALESLSARNRTSSQPEATAQAEPSSSLTRASAAPPPVEPLSEELHQLWNELVARHDQAKEQNLFEVLGLGQNATTQEVKGAFLPLIKKWHPDRLPPELSDLRPWADRYFHKINQAHDTLSNPKKRAEYVASLGGEVDQEQEQVDRTLRAAMEFRKVEVLMKRRLWNDAEELLQTVFELDDSDADFYVAKAKILLQKMRSKGTRAQLSRVSEALDQAIALHAEHVEAWYMRGELAEREDDGSRALKAYKRVLSLAPSHLQASRKVRLANMRTRNENSMQSDLLGRLFGKKK